MRSRHTQKKGATVAAVTPSLVPAPCIWGETQNQQNTSVNGEVKGILRVLDSDCKAKNALLLEAWQAHPKRKPDRGHGVIKRHSKLTLHQVGDGGS